MIGLFLLLAMVLYLIDKNRAWGKFWKSIKAFALVVLVVATVDGAYLLYLRERSAKTQAVTLDFSKAQPIDAAQSAPDFIPVPAQQVTPPPGFELEPTPWEEACVKQVRAKFVGAYDDLSDAVLAKRIRDKFSGQCPVSDLHEEVESPDKPLQNAWVIDGRKNPCVDAQGRIHASQAQKAIWTDYVLAKCK